MNLRRSGPFIGVGGMATTAFLYAYSAIALPSLETLLFLPAVWLVCFALSLLWFTRYPLHALALPFFAAAVWFVVMLT